MIVRYVEWDEPGTLVTPRTRWKVPVYDALPASANVGDMAGLESDPDVAYTFVGNGWLRTTADGGLQPGRLVTYTPS